MFRGAVSAPTLSINAKLTPKQDVFNFANTCLRGFLSIWIPDVARRNAPCRKRTG